MCQPGLVSQQQGSRGEDGSVRSFSPALQGRVRLRAPMWSLSQPSQTSPISITAGLRSSEEKTEISLSRTREAVKRTYAPSVKWN